ncbi:NIL domain-containing protein [Lentzea sp. NPDC051208]|uniref:NIL domain-containing protein n=1 Tax=Lentzea sp. NPDC051208 TaxID=3154642 RepID=UPI0034221EBE
MLLIDEPTSALSAECAASVMTTLDRVRAEHGVTVVVVTQDASVVRSICDDVALLESGKVVEHGKVLDLAIDPDSRIASSLLPTVRRTTAADGAFDRVAEVLLVGFAAVGSLLPEVGTRFGVRAEVISGGFTRLGDTPVARSLIGFTGDRIDAALEWLRRAGVPIRVAPSVSQKVLVA